MKRFHVNVGVSNLARSVTFYSRLFGVAPTREESDYAKWMLDDPPLNFSVSTRVAGTGVNHVGVQAGDEAELADLRGRLQAADLAVLEQGEVTCCYARSTKAWVQDPDGLAWETFLTREDATEYGDASVAREQGVRAASAPSDPCCS